MKFDLNPDVAQWLDTVRGKLSRQAYITKILREQMINEERYLNRGDFKERHSLHYGQQDKECSKPDGTPHLLS